MDFGVAGGASTAGSSFRNFCSRTNVHLFTMIHVRQRKRSSSVSPPSMPSWDIFEHQPQSYRESVLPAEIKARIAVEQGSALGWDRYVGAAGRVIGMETFGASAPLKELQCKFGFEPERIVDLAREMLGGKQ